MLLQEKTFKTIFAAFPARVCELVCKLNGEYGLWLVMSATYICKRTYSTDVRYKPLSWDALLFLSWNLLLPLLVLFSLSRLGFSFFLSWDYLHSPQNSTLPFLIKLPSSMWNSSWFLPNFCFHYAGDFPIQFWTLPFFPENLLSSTLNLLFPGQFPSILWKYFSFFLGKSP